MNIISDKNIRRNHVTSIILQLVSNITKKSKIKIDFLYTVKNLINFNRL